MDLNLDILSKNDNEIIIALSHYYDDPCGDLIPDPDMTIKVNVAFKIAEALSYQDSRYYNEVYCGENLVNVRLQKSLNHFLKTWLSNCINQGHRLVIDSAST